MSEPAVPNEKPPYWSTCESMTLPRLGMFIYDALKRLSEPKGPTNGSTPLSRREFSDIVGLMQARADAQREDATMPARPVYEGPAVPTLYSYSYELEAACSKRDDALERLEGAYRYGQGENRTRQLHRELREAERATPLIEAEKKGREEEYLQRRREYQQAHKPFEREFSAWKRAVTRAELRREANGKRQDRVDRARRMVAEAFGPKRETDLRGLITHDFEIARPDEQGDEHMRTYFSEVVGRGGLEGKWSQERFEKMLALPRSRWQEGKAGFYGYIVIEFDHTERVVLESPGEGNAIYVLDSAEDRLLGLNKRQLRESGEAKRIFHSGNDWYRRLKDELGVE